MTPAGHTQPLPKTPAQQAWSKHWPFARATPALVRQVQREHAAQQRQGPVGFEPAPF